MFRSATMPRLPLRSLCGLCAFARVPAPSAFGEACQSLQPFFPDHDRALQNTSQRPRGCGPFIISIPQRQAQKGLAAAKRQLNQQSWFWMWCNMRSPLLCSGSRQMAAANGVAVCPAHIIPHTFFEKKVCPKTLAGFSEAYLKKGFGEKPYSAEPQTAGQAPRLYRPHREGYGRRRTRLTGKPCRNRSATCGWAGTRRGRRGFDTSLFAHRGGRDR